MSLAAANLIGLLGSVLMVLGYAYSNVAKRMNFALFNLLNLVGSALMIVSLSIAFNLAAMLLEVTWAAIAGFGLVRALLRGRAA